MRNDLIVLEFYADERDIALPIPLLTAIVAHLESALNEVATDLPSHLRIELLLAAADRGSFRTAFQTAITTARGITPSRETMAVIADLTTIMTGAVGLVTGTGMALGYFKPEAETPKEMQIQLAATTPPSAELTQALEGLVDQAYRSGAKKVTISAPGAPTCVLSEEAFSSSELFGSRISRNAPTLPAGDVAGTLTLLDERIRVRDLDKGEDRYIYVGELVIEKHKAIVLVDWQSKRVAPEPGETAAIKGVLERIDNARTKFQALSPVRNESRRARGLLVVKTQMVEE